MAVPHHVDVSGFPVYTVTLPHRIYNLYNKVSP